MKTSGTETGKTETRKTETGKEETGKTEIATPPTGRFAPSPSGRMHLGNLFCSLLAWLSAKSAGGRVVLRIEDLDPLRCPRSFADHGSQKHDHVHVCI